MAYRRAISTRATLLARSRFSPSFPYIHHDDDCKNHQDKNVSPFQQRAYGSYVNRTDIDTLFQRQRCFHPFSSPLTGLSIGRHMSTMNNSGPDKNELFTDVAEVLGDQTVEAVTAADPVVSEVAIAAADSAFPVAALQYLIDNVHSFTGLNWWSSIVVTTLLIRGAMIPLLINQLKSTTKLSLLRPHLEEIKVEMQEKSMDPDAVANGQRRMTALFKEYGVTPFTPLKGLLLQGPIFISFFLAINNMVEKVPSFKHGGMSWFTDLTTPDSLYILPALTALSFWITVESNMQEGMEGNPAANTMKKVSRVFAVLTVPITMNFPKALFCYWVTSNLFSLSYGLVMKAPGVKKFLGVPEIPVEPPRPTTTTTPQYSFFEAMKKYAEATQARAVASRVESAKPAVETPKSEAADERIASSPVSQKLKLLERQVKLRKKNKKR